MNKIWKDMKPYIMAILWVSIMISGISFIFDHAPYHGWGATPLQYLANLAWTMLAVFWFYLSYGILVTLFYLLPNAIKRMKNEKGA